MKKAILFFVILCAILGYFIFIRDTTIVADINTTEVKNNQANPVSSDKPRAQTKSVSPNNTAVKTSTRVATPNINQTALPAIDLPLVQSLPLLISESESGNAKASCRLAAQIFMCKVKTIQKTDVWQKVLAEQKIAAQLGMKVFEDLAEWTDNEINIKSKTERDVLKAKICDGFDASLALQPWEYQFRAALQGHVASMAQFAISPPLIPSIHFVADDAPAWKAYRENAANFLKGAADKGNIRAIFVSAKSYQREFSGEVGVNLTKEDHFEATKLAFIYQSIENGRGSNEIYSPENLKKLKDKIGEAAFSRAEQQAKIEYAKMPSMYMESQYTQLKNKDNPIILDKCVGD